MLTTTLMSPLKHSIYNSEGKIILYGLQDFYNNIVKGDDCFICGAKRGSKKFNDEHVLPDWLLTKYKLHNKEITLSNRATFKYGRYKISCCEECNSELSKQIEKPVSDLLKLSYSEICKKLETDQKYLPLLFKWMMLIFFKCHLKDKDFRWHLDKRKSNEKISDTYDWSDMFHIHCVIRKHFTKAIVNAKVLGSVFILPTIKHSGFDNFDFIDNKLGKSIMLRMDEFSIVCILDDSCIANNFFSDYMNKIKGPLTPFQLIEVFCHYTYINLHLKNRPIYFSEFKAGKYYIKAKIPKKLELVDKELELVSLGDLLYYYCKDRIGKIKNKRSILNDIKKGNRAYLFDEKGEFINHSKDFE